MKILLVGPSWVGDSVMSQSLLKVLLSQKKSIEIDVLSPKWTSSIFHRMSEVSQVILSPFEHGDIKLQERWKLGLSLRTKNYKKAIVLPNSLKSSLVPFFAKIPERVGWVGEKRYLLLNDLRNLDKVAYPRMVDRFVALAMNDKQSLPLEIPYPKLNVEKSNQKALSKRHDFKTDLPTISLCPGAEFGPAKRWPPEYFSKVADHFLKKEWQVIVLGSINDAPLCKQIESRLDPENTGLLFNLSGLTNIVDAIDILAFSSLVLTNDSGLMHIAASVGTHLVALYGPSSPDFTPPLSKKAIVLRKENGYRTDRVGTLPGGYDESMASLKPNETIEALERIQI